ncbi:MAG: tetratricopeptide repeat protein [Phycisphaerae bacterium]|nr:tetratricopeptide repeat protein [Phycisphaerae bacterium]
MKRIIPMVMGLLFLAAGCQQPSVKEAKKEVYGKWSVSRANVLYSLARDHLAGGHVDKACSNAEEGLSLDPESKDLRFLLARIYIEKGYYSRSIGLLQLLVQQEQQDTQDKHPGLLAEMYYLLGAAQEKEGRLEEALASYNRSAELDRSTIAPILAATEVLVAMGNVEKAQDFLACQTGRYAPEPAAAELAGRLAMMRKQYVRAAKQFQLACDLDSENKRYPELLASAQYAAGEYAQAGETLNRLLRRKGYKGPAWVYTLLGDCMMARNRYEPAEKAYQKACLARPEEPAAWTRLAKAALAMNHLTKAIRSAHQARSLDANHLDAAILLGYSLLRVDKPDKAVEVLLDAAKAHPNDEIVLCLLGRAYGKMGRDDLAKQFYEAAGRIRPDSPLLEGLLAVAK